MGSEMVKEFKIGIVEKNATEIKVFKAECTSEIIKMARELGWDSQIEEYVYVICVNKLNRVVSYSEVSHGNINSSIVDPRGVFSRALLSNARGVVIVHNHPSGDPTPSQCDIDITRRLKDSGVILGINLVDHIILGDSDYISLKNYGCI